MFLSDRTSRHKRATAKSTCAAMTVMPGLIDVHTHLTMDTNFDPYHELSTNAIKEALIGVVNAKTTLLAGFTSIRNVGASGYCGCRVER